MLRSPGQQSPHGSQGRRARRENQKALEKVAVQAVKDFVAHSIVSLGGMTDDRMEQRRQVMTGKVLGGSPERCSERSPGLAQYVSVGRQVLRVVCMARLAHGDESSSQISPPALKMGERAGLSGSQQEHPLVETATGIAASRPKPGQRPLVVLHCPEPIKPSGILTVAAEHARQRPGCTGILICQCTWK